MTMKSFTLKTKGQNLCLTIKGNKKDEIVATNCSSSSLNMRWIWVNKTGKTRLMNVMTLQCLEFLTKGDVCRTGKYVPKNQTGQVAMKQCKDIDRQYIIMGTKLISSYPCGIRVMRAYYLQLNQQHNDSHYPVESQRNPTPAPQEWTNEGENLHHKSSNYTGQYNVLGQ